MCNKQHTNEDEIRLDFKEHQLQCIAVDNENFYSDHVIVRKPDILDSQEYKRALAGALPHEFRPFKKDYQKRTKPNNESDDYSSEDFYYNFENYKLTRHRSKSDTYDDELVIKLNHVE